MKNAYTVLAGITETRTLLGRLRYRHEDNIKMYLKEIILENYLSQKRLHKCGFLNSRRFFLTRQGTVSKKVPAQ
jgi:hypothetical protein